MSTFTIRVTNSGLNPSGTSYGEQPDLGAPSYWDVYISNSSDPNLPNGVYDGYCLNPSLFIYGYGNYEAQNAAGNSVAAFQNIGLANITSAQVDQINWILAQNFTSDSKYLVPNSSGGLSPAFNFGEVQ